MVLDGGVTLDSRDTLRLVLGFSELPSTSRPAPLALVTRDCLQLKGSGSQPISVSVLYPQKWIVTKTPGDARSTPVTPSAQ